MTGSWLCRDDTDRERLVEMERHLRPVRAIAMGLIFISVIGSVGFLDVGVLSTAIIGVIVAAGLFWLADQRMGRSERPEYVMFAAWVGAEAVIAACIVVTGGPDSPGLAWIAIPVVTLSARFSTRGVVLGLAITLALLFGATLGVDPAAVIAKPTLVITPAVLVFSIAILSLALMQSDLHYRDAAVVDPLTGMLNRKALANRALELEQQSEITGHPVGVIVGDLDHFKGVNDSLGHAAGDAVLKDVAYRLRKRLRAFDLAYRIGGEEFLVLLPGAGPQETFVYAEELRGSVEAKPVGDGVEMTMSFGVATSPSGLPFHYESVFAAADAGLYEAKRSGRNKVIRADESANGSGSAAGHERLPVPNPG